MSTLMSGWLSRMRSVAVTPSIPGILRSMTTTSGLLRAHSASASPPSAARPTTSTSDAHGDAGARRHLGRAVLQPGDELITAQRCAAQLVERLAQAAQRAARARLEVVEMLGDDGLGLLVAFDQLHLHHHGVQALHH